MLDFINEARAEAGVPSVVMGTNQAAQIHSENALAGCFSGHWGLDGTKPYMRYATAGGYQSNGENVSGLNVCVRAGQGYAPLRGIEYEVRKTMKGFMNSPGHRRTIIGTTYKKVNLGIAWDSYNWRVVQHFEGGHLEFERPPTLENGVLSLEGTLHDGAALVPGDINKDLGIQIYYDPPLRELTRGQVARAYSYGYGAQVAAVRPPAGAGYYYTTNNFTPQVCSTLDPYEVPTDSPAPRTPEESNHLIDLPRYEFCIALGSQPWLDASRWKLETTSFDVWVNLRPVLKGNGPGIYTVVLWANVNGEPEVVGEYPIFHETEPPEGYGS